MGAYDTHAAVTDREDVDPASDGLAWRSEPPRQRSGVGANLPWAVFFEDVACQQAIVQVAVKQLRRFWHWIAPLHSEARAIRHRDRCPLR